MKFTVVLEKATGGFTAQCVEIPGAISEGKSESEALQNIQDAIALILEVRRERARHSGGHVETVEVDA